MEKKIRAEVFLAGRDMPHPPSKTSNLDSFNTIPARFSCIGRLRLFLQQSIPDITMRIFIFILFTGLFSCSPGGKFHKDKPLFDASAIQMKFRSVADMNDAVFEIRENDFFEFYRQLFDSIKNSSYPGRYHKNGDTLVLDFYNKKGVDLLGNKALIDSSKNEIRFYR